MILRDVLKNHARTALRIVLDVLENHASMRGGLRLPPGEHAGCRPKISLILWRQALSCGGYLSAIPPPLFLRTMRVLAHPR
jgi:hypothetical protein